MNGQYEYEVALSFAGENRTYVKQVADYLKNHNISVFYDDYEKEKLWGKNLVQYLEDVYTNKAKFCVIFISKFYAEKQWTCYESATAMQRMLADNVKKMEYILPVRFDETIIPGILSTIGYIDIRDVKPEELGVMLQKKLDFEKVKLTLTFNQIESHTMQLIKTNHLNQNYKIEIDSHSIILKDKDDIGIKCLFKEKENIILLYKMSYNNSISAKIPSARIIISTYPDGNVEKAQIYNTDLFDTFVKKVIQPYDISQKLADIILNGAK